MAPDDSQDIPVEVQVRFQAALTQFRGECFWAWDITQPALDRAQVREIIRNLRLHGGKPGWRTAAELVRCL